MLYRRGTFISPFGPSFGWDHANQVPVSYQVCHGKGPSLLKGPLVFGNALPLNHRQWCRPCISKIISNGDAKLYKINRKFYRCIQISTVITSTLFKHFSIQHCYFVVNVVESYFGTLWTLLKVVLARCWKLFWHVINVVESYFGTLKTSLKFVLARWKRCWKLFWHVINVVESCFGALKTLLKFVWHVVNVVEWCFHKLKRTLLKVVLLRCSSQRWNVVKKIWHVETLFQFIIVLIQLQCSYVLWLIVCTSAKINAY